VIKLKTQNPQAYSSLKANSKALLKIIHGNCRNSGHLGSNSGQLNLQLLIGNQEGFQDDHNKATQIKRLIATTLQDVNSHTTRIIITVVKKKKKTEADSFILSQLAVMWVMSMETARI
jgi:hypothetical protein